MTLPSVLYSVLAAAAISLFAVLIHGLTPSGGAVAFVLLSLIGICGGAAALLTITVSFFLVALVGKAVKRRTAVSLDGVHEKSGARDGVQVAVNGIPAAVMLVLYSVTKDAPFLLAYYAAIAEALGDSLASDVGVLSKRPPRSAITMKPVMRGMSGGVSLLGTLSAATGIAAVTLLYFAFTRASLVPLLSLFAVAFIGVWLDSLLGATVQVRYVCSFCGKATEKTHHCGKATEKAGGISFMNNDAVNLLSGALTVAVAVPVGYLLL